RCYVVSFLCVSLLFPFPEKGPVLQSLFDQDFEAVLRSPQVLDLLGGGDCSDGEAIDAILERLVLAYLNDGTEEDKADREIALLALVVASLHIFVQSNWTGPHVTIHVPELLPPALLSSLTEPGALTSALLGRRLLDGESVYSLVWNPFLLLARVLLVNCAIKLDSLQ
uniref:Tetratricopeptide repeat domain 27 n=1 Tax=Hucho hucho TaxID=62062 RepID=A0A4W5NG68_9TELE